MRDRNRARKMFKLLCTLYIAIPIPHFMPGWESARRNFLIMLT
jgi:hypothetical protein